MTECIKCGYEGANGNCPACGFNELDDRNRKHQEITALLEKILETLREGIKTYER